MTESHIEKDAINELKASERLQTLYVVNELLRQADTEGLNINAILPRVLNVAVQQLNGKEGSIIVVNQNLEIEHTWLTDDGPNDFLDNVMTSGVAGWVIRNQQASMINDTRYDTRWLPRPNHATSIKPWSVICAPFISQGRAIGALTIHKEGADQFDKRDLNMLTVIANHAASRIENARLYDTSQKQLRITALLNKASRVINSSLDLNQIMQSLLYQANELLNAQAISIALVDKKTNELVYQVAEGTGADEIVGLRLPSNQGLSGWVMEHGAPALVTDAKADPRFDSMGDKRTGHSTEAMICVPIQFKNQVLGTIQAINPTKQNFDEASLELLVNLANIASSAFANAQQFARTQAAEERYLNLFQGGADPIILTDFDGRIVEANDRALQLLDYGRDDLLGRPINHLHLKPIALSQVEDKPDGKVTAITNKIITSQQQRIPVEIYVIQTHSGDSILLQWVYHDISKQVELEQMREDLTAMLYHDLQSPLGNVISSLELLNYEIPPDSDPALLSMLDIARRSSLRLQSLIRSLLDVNQLEAGHPISQQKTVTVNSLVDDVNEMEKPSLEKRRVNFVRKIPADIPDVYVERDMIRRVLMNLVDNALKYSQGTDIITVSATRLPDKNMVHIAVSDQGVGIPEEHRASIFKKFERIKRGTSSRGLGLGLAFCRLAVEAHDGRIWVDDTPGGGARFNFTLPIRSESN